MILQSFDCDANMQQLGKCPIKIFALVLALVIGNNVSDNLKNQINKDLWAVDILTDNSLKNEIYSKDNKVPKLYF